MSGHEHPIRDVIAAAWRDLADDLQVGALGSLTALKRGRGRKPRPRVMLAAHMDNIGFMVSGLKGEFLRVSSIGGIDARVMPGQPVTVHGRRDLPGLVVAPSDFLLPASARGSVVPVGELLVDLGLRAADVARQVSVGDVVSFAQGAASLNGGLLASPALDNRASVAAVTVCLESLSGRAHEWDVLAVATTQEEVGLHGALTAAYALAPQLAIAIDVTFGSGPAVRDFADRCYELGKGPTIAFGPNLHPVVYKHLVDCAERGGFSYQSEPVAAHSGTDARAIQIAREGVPCALLGHAVAQHAHPGRGRAPAGRLHRRPVDGRLHRRPGPRLSGPPRPGVGLTDGRLPRRRANPPSPTLISCRSSLRPSRCRVMKARSGAW